MNEMTVVRSDEIAIEINLLKRDTARKVLSASCEIGALLVEAKEAVGYGEWEAWLQSHVQYSVRTAQNLMKLHKEYGEGSAYQLLSENSLDIFADMDMSKALVLADMPAQDRVKIVEEIPIDEMTVRQLREEVKKREEAEAEAAKLRVLAGEDGERIRALEAEIEKARAEVAEVKAKPTPPEKAKESTQKLVDLKKKHDEEIRKLKDKLKKVEDAGKEKERALQEYKASEEERVQEMSDGMRETIEADLRKEFLAEQEKTQEKMKKLQSPTLQKIGIYFEMLQKQLAALSSLFKDLQNEAPEDYARLQTVYNQTLEKNMLGLEVEQT